MARCEIRRVLSQPQIRRLVQQRKTLAKRSGQDSPTSPVRAGFPVHVPRPGLAERLGMRTVALIFLISISTACQRTPHSQPPNPVIILGKAINVNSKCVGHAEHLCGPEDETLSNEIAGVFATEPNCQGVTLRGLRKQEETTPSNQIPLLLYVYYQGTRGDETLQRKRKGRDRRMDVHIRRSARTLCRKHPHGTGTGE